MSAVEMARAERRDLADFCVGLSSAEWEALSLCAGWRVRDVVAHIVSYEGLGAVGFAGCLVRGRLSPHRANREAVASLAESDPAQLLKLLRGAQEPKGVPTAFGGRIVLADRFIHHQDLRRLLGTPRAVPAERLLVALPLALLAPVIGGAWHVRGVRLVATDLDWSWGAGPEARGHGKPCSWLPPADAAPPTTCRDPVLSCFDGASAEQARGAAADQPRWAGRPEGRPPWAGRPEASALVGQASLAKTPIAAKPAGATVLQARPASGTASDSACMLDAVPCGPATKVVRAAPWLAASGVGALAGVVPV